ncbi:MAG: hypothetical protein ACXWYT_08050 [Actinomycetota bacterium]
MTRVCDCGCGEQLKGGAQQRFSNAAHRMRASRTRTEPERKPEQNPNIQAEPEQAGGSVRAGLEQWLAGQDPLPQALVELARVTADEVDSAPGRSPMHGRYQTVLAALTEAASTISPEGLEVLWELRNPDCKRPAEHGSSVALTHCAICCRETAAVHAL